jgi:adenylate cyclase
MKRASFVIAALLLAVAAIYLFASAPPLLPENGGAFEGAVPIEHVLATVAAENDVVRALYTREIVTNGALRGLAFDEKWRDAGVQAGPLPALFLREAARSLQGSGIELGLFLGSDYPISPSNRFQGTQVEVFERLKRRRMPEYFYAEDTGLYNAMFPDLASVPGCVSCHNEHAESPKVDWVLDEVMGATTWTYPKETVSQAEYLRIVAAVRQSFRDAYSRYLEKVGTFDAQPEIGDRWPSEGFYLPDLEVFMEEFGRRSSSATVDRLLLQERLAD